jgi:hypothetical protein
MKYLNQSYKVLLWSTTKQLWEKESYPVPYMPVVQKSTCTNKQITQYSY